MQGLVYDIETTLRSLKKSISGRYSVAKERAEAEYQYRTALGREMAMQKANGMAATALYDYCRGIDHIAELRCKRDILASQEDYLTELIFYYRSELRVLEGQLKAERQGL